MATTTKQAHEFSKYEKARILGARALQVSMDAPVLLKMKGEELENLRFDPLKIARAELESGVLPISVVKPMPKKKEEDLEKIKIEKLTPEEIERKAKLEEKREKESHGTEASPLTVSDEEEPSTDMEDLSSDEDYSFSE